MVSSLFTRAAALALTSLAALMSSTTAASLPPAPSAHDLPIFFFHGINSNAASGNVLKANLSTDARPFVGLSFCETICTLSDLNTQAQLAIKQIRNYTASDSRFDKGYVFVAHSLGGAVARAVIEEMDDHKVHTFISLAGAVNGISYGPQESDLVPGQIFLKNYAPVFYSTSVFDYTKYTVEDIKTGKLQVAVAQLLADKPELQVTAGTQLVRSPVEASWISYSGFFPGVNNLKPATTDAIKADQARRKNNFLKLQAAHFFASPFDETVAPWQSAQLAQYNAVASIDEYATNFSKLKIVPVTETTEYTKDTYGLQTLDKRGGLFFHTFENVPHSGWLRDTTSPRDGKVYPFAPVYEKGLYPLLAPRVDTPTPTPAPTTLSPKPAC